MYLRFWFRTPPSCASYGSLDAKPSAEKTKISHSCRNTIFKGGTMAAFGRSSCTNIKKLPLAPAILL